MLLGRRAAWEHPSPWARSCSSCLDLSAQQFWARLGGPPQPSLGLWPATKTQIPSMVQAAPSALIWCPPQRSANGFGAWQAENFCP